MHTYRVRNKPASVQYCMRTVSSEKADMLEDFLRTSLQDELQLFLLLPFCLNDKQSVITLAKVSAITYYNIISDFKLKKVIELIDFFNPQNFYKLLKHHTYFEA